MNYQTTNDELYMMYLEHNEYAENELFKRFRIIINSNLKKYNSIIKHLKINKSDLYSEALFGVLNGLYSYQFDKNTSINTFINLCIERRLCKFITTNNRFKNQINNMAITLDNEYDTLIDNKDPLSIILKKESMKEISNKAKQVLSKFEYKVYRYKIKGYKNNVIAKLLNKSSIQITNANQRIKKKLQNT